MPVSAGNARCSTRSRSKAWRVNSMLCAMYGRSRTSWFGLTTKPPTYHETTGQTDVDDDSRRERHEQRGQLPRADAVVDRDRGARDQRDRDQQEAGDDDVRLGVADAGEDRVILEQAVVAREDEAAPPRSASPWRARTTRRGSPARRSCTPANTSGLSAFVSSSTSTAAARMISPTVVSQVPSELPDGQREEVEGQRPSEDGVGERGFSRGGRRVPGTGRTWSTRTSCRSRRRARRRAPPPT